MHEQDRHVVIGTAGHVDHGKTSLIRALTGHDTDRLAEEKARGISIDLGFAPFRLPDGQTAGVVDVPGHERFVSNMLAGIGGIDLVLLVIDVMEGVRPQTREHLQIMELLRIQRGLLVLNKCDLATEEWIDLVEEEVREEISGTFLHGAPACRVSAATGQGVPQLIEAVQRSLSSLQARDVAGPARLPVDRAFTVPGFGTVVSGTLLSGRVAVGDTVEVLPLERKVRVRGVQVHGRKVDAAYAGQRTALNLADVEREKVPRGSTVAAPGALALTSRIDARMRLLPDARPLSFRDQVHLYLGTARTVATVQILDREKLEPGEEALVQLHLAEPLPAARRDLFVVRSYSPMITIGGGAVIDPLPPRHRRLRVDVVEALRDLESGDDGFLLRKLGAAQCATAPELARIVGIGAAEVEARLGRLGAERLGDQWALPEAVRGWQALLVEETARHHAENPLLSGIPHATARARLPPALKARAYEEVLARTVGSGSLTWSEDWLCVPGHVPRPTPEQARLIALLEEAWRSDGLQIHSRIATLQRLDVDPDAAHPCLQHLVATGRLVKLDEDTFLHATAYEAAVSALVEHFSREPTLTLSAFRDRLGAARKHVQALLEHFDARKLTTRRGDERVPGRLPSP